MTTQRQRDDIDQIVQSLLNNPDQADAIKRQLSGDVAKFPKTVKRSAEVYDIDDYFDNMPV